MATNPSHPPRPAEILADWRAAERELATAEPGTPEYEALAARIHELATRYQTSLREPAPPPRR